MVAAKIHAPTSDARRRREGNAVALRALFVLISIAVLVLCAAFFPVGL